MKSLYKASIQVHRQLTDCESLRKFLMIITNLLNGSLHLVLSNNEHFTAFRKFSTISKNINLFLFIILILTLSRYQLLLFNKYFPGSFGYAVLSEVYKNLKRRAIVAVFALPRSCCCYYCCHLQLVCI